MKAKRFLGVVLALVLALGLQPVRTYAAESAAEGTIAIVFTNDVHCGVEPAADEEGAVTNIGYAGVAGIVNYLESNLGETNVTLVDAGDAVQGDAIGTMSKGQYLVDIMNEVGYDIFVPGNHEFDYGMEQMLNLMNQINGEVISSNFIDLATGNSVFAPYAVVSYGDTNVAFVGITTPEAFSKSTPAYFQDDAGNFIYGLSESNNGADLYAAVQSAVDAAAQEADYVIAVGHLGVDEASAPWRSTDVIANTTGIDVFIDAHSHTVQPGVLTPNAIGEDVILAQTGTKLANIGVIAIDPAADTLASYLVSNFNAFDPGIESFIAGIMSEFEADLAEIVATTDVALTVNDPATGNRIVRSQETNLGDLAADAYRFVLGNGAGGPADVAWVNGGGVRADIAEGEVSFGEVIAVHPFNNVGCVVEATGQEIIDALEMASRAVPGENGGFLQVSGISYTIDASVASTVETNDQGGFTGVTGERRVKDVLIGGQPVDVNATYTVASHNYMLLDGGDGINMFQDNNIVVQPVILDNQVLITYIQEYLGGVVGADYANAYGQGRITILAGEAPEAPAADGAASDRWPGDGEPGIDWWYNNLLEGKELWSR